MYPDDEQYESVLEERMADHFAEAVARLEEGESVDSILASYPADEATELRGMLFVSDAMAALQHAPLPMRTPQRQAARRAQFMDQVLLERTRHELAAPRPLIPDGYTTISTAGAAGAPNGRTPASGTRAAPARRTLGWWGALQDMLTVGNLRLAPLIVTLTIALTSALGLWQVTSASLPGDLAYPIKAWVKMMNLGLTEPARRSEVSAAAAETIQADFAASAQRAENLAADGAAIDGVVHQESVALIFEGYDGRLLKFGDIRVLPSYQPSPDNAATLPMVVEGDLQPGSQVWVTVQILPGQADVVQGVRAVVQEAAPAAPAAAAATAIPCTPRRPAGWANYTVARGDTLTELAARTRTTIRELARANCLESDVILRGQLLFVPQRTAAPQLAAPTPPPAGTVPLP